MDAVPVRQPRWVAIGVCLATVAVAVVLAWVWTAWWLCAVPFALGAAYGAALGLTNSEIEAAFDSHEPDPGAGAPGMS